MTRGRESTTRAQRRPDLQGVRALAVLLVALNHARVSFLPGGYVGVDVFFVLSGYFITGVLLRDGHSAAGEPSRLSGLIPRFYARRIRRILPAACLTIVVTSLAVYVVYDLHHADYLGTKPALGDALAAALFFANLRFQAGATNYFAQTSGALPSPFQHFWSLSVEEQFYLVWPALVLIALLVAGLFARRRTRPAAPAAPGTSPVADRTGARILGLWLAVICGVSLYLSIHLTATDAASAYFSTFARAWELGAGAALALVQPQLRRTPPAVRELLGCSGLGLIIYAAVAYSSATAFPGLAALVPVGGSMLLIAAGSSTPTSVGRLLGTRPLTLLGDRSYTFYLWHWPALIITWQAIGHPGSTGLNLLLLLGALALSCVTFAGFENPIRFAGWARGWRVGAICAVALAASLAAVLIPVASVNHTIAVRATTAVTARRSTLALTTRHPDPRDIWDPLPIPAVQRAVAASRRRAPLPGYFPAATALPAQHETRYDMPDRCLPVYPTGITPRHLCHLGETRSRAVVAVIGDSHAQQWIGALVSAAPRLHIQVVPLVKPGCLISRIHTDLPGLPCGRWYSWAVREDHALHPAATVTSWLMSTFAQQEPLVLRYLAIVLADVHNGVVFPDPPSYGNVQPGDCLTRPGATMATCSAHVPAWYPGFLEQLQHQTAREHHGVISTLQWFCGRGVCPMVVNHTVVYHDTNHMTPQYSNELGALLVPELAPILRRAAAQPVGPGGASGG